MKARRGMIAIGAAYGTLGRGVQGTLVSGGEGLARTICVWALIAMFLTLCRLFRRRTFWSGFYCHVELPAVTVLELRIIPDVSGANAIASLAQLRLA